MGGDDITLGELARRLDQVQAAIGDLSNRLDRDFVRRGETGETSRRINALEATQTWLVRTVIGAVVIGLLGMLLQQSIT